MRTIWKFELEIKEIQTLQMPMGATILSVAKQKGELKLWAMVNPRRQLEDRKIEIIGTGGVLPADMGTTRGFIGTVVIDPFVWHVFERMT